MQVTLSSERGFYNQIAQDCKTSLIQVVSEAGHGKSSSLKTIIQHIQRTDPNIKFIVFDCSQSWFHCAPVKYRQLVTRERIQQGKISNEYDTVYEIGSLNEAEKRFFVGTVIQQILNQRYTAKLEGKLDEYPYVVFVVEEANIFFGSYSFRRNDEYSQTFQTFASVGRNYKCRGILIATVEESEISPSLRRRSRKLYGRVISRGDLQTAKKLGITEDLAKIPKYTFTYYGQTLRIPDECTNVPEDFQRFKPTTQPTNSGLNWLAGFMAPIVILLLFLAYFA